VGANPIVTDWEPPAAIVPLVQLEVNPSGTVMPLTVRAPVPLFVIVIVAMTVLPTTSSPKSNFPATPMVLVVEVLGELGLELPPPPHELLVITARRRRAVSAQHEEECIAYLLLRGSIAAETRGRACTKLEGAELM
jgi:hypothetical protein